MGRLFLPDSPYKKPARSIAILWTLLIFVGCFTPAREISRVDVPLIDKWTHLVMFGGFTFLWLCARPAYTLLRLFVLFFVSVLLGCFTEIMQHQLVFLGRSGEVMDVVADTIGGALGIGMFCIGARLTKPRRPL